jgi:hypothetical protein
MKKVIDIIVQVSSKPEYLEATLKSIHEQDGLDSAIVYVIENNIGNAESSQHVEKLALGYGFNYVFFAERLSIYQNWNRCLNVGLLTWIHFVHDDDLIQPGHIRHCLEASESSDLILAGYRYFKDSRGINHLYSGWDGRDPILTSNEEALGFLMSNCFHMSALCFRRSLEIEFNVNKRYCVDQEFVRAIGATIQFNRFSFISASFGANIRDHAKQDQKQGNINLLAARELAEINQTLIENALISGLNPEILAKALLNYGGEQIAIRCLSSAAFSWPLIPAFILISSATRLSSNPLRFLGTLLIRVGLQRFIWKWKETKVRR